MKCICRAVVWILICILTVQNVAVSLPENEDGKILFERRFLLDQISPASNMTLEQFASCYLTCVSGFERLTETCCKTGIGAVCSNLPWNLLKPRLGKCAGALVTPVPAVLTSLEQFAACSLTCVPGYEKLAEVCCQTGMDAICSNLPWALLKNSLGTCQAEATLSTTMMSPTMTSPMKSVPSTSQSPTTRPTNTTPIPTTQTTPQLPYWFLWGEWKCRQQNGACFMTRLRNCSTGVDGECAASKGGKNYNFGLCTQKSCPAFFTTTTTTVPTTTQDSCLDDPLSIGCGNPDVVKEVCKDNAAGWKLCRRSCGLCDTCWDYLNCSAPGAQKLLCGREDYALQYCRKTCGRCANKPVDAQLNKCGDPVSSEVVCQLLQTESCICNDPDVRALCANFCDNKCTDHPYPGSDCKPPSRRKRDAIFRQVMSR